MNEIIKPSFDCVDRSDAIKVVKTMKTPYLIEEGIKKLQAAKPIPKMGHWVWKMDVSASTIFRYCECSECGRGMEKHEYNYCPNCGTKMQEVDE